LILIALTLAGGGMAAHAAGEPPVPTNGGCVVIGPRHDWTVIVAGHRFGLTQYHELSGPQIWWGDNSADVPLSAPAVAALALGIPTLLAGCAVALLRREQRSFPGFSP
jgi:hypothetical protein